MGDDVKKISFGFSKLAKKTAIVSNQLNKVKPQESQVEFIDCLEEKSIKLKEPVESEEKILIIPLKKRTEGDNINKLEVKTKLANIFSENLGLDDKPTVLNKDTLTIDTNNIGSETPSRICEPSTLDELAAKEIMEDLNKKTEEETRVFSVPLTSNAPTGEKESSIEDYEQIPVNLFGMAMLRGMGWAPGKGIGKNEKVATTSMPTLRPKGMGLGADKAVIIASDSKTTSEELKMVKGAYVRVVAGSYKDSYGQIEGFDDESGRMFVKLVLKNTVISLNEFMVQLVSKHDFTKNSKVINVGKYEQYKVEEKANPLKENLVNEKPVKTDKLNKTSSKPNSKSNSDSYYKQSLSSPENTNIVKKITSFKTQQVKDTLLKNRRRSDSSLSSDDGYKRRRSRSVSKVRRSRTPSKTTRKNRDKKYSRTPSTSSSSSLSDDSRRRHKSRTKKKKPSSHKYKSRSRSRSPRKHKSSKPKKHKKSKY